MVLVMCLLLMLTKKALIKSLLLSHYSSETRESSSPISNEKVFSVSSAKEEGGYRERQTQTEIICGTIGTDQNDTKCL